MKTTNSVNSVIFTLETKGSTNPVNPCEAMDIPLPGNNEGFNGLITSSRAYANQLYYTSVNSSPLHCITLVRSSIALEESLIDDKASPTVRDRSEVAHV